MVSNSNDMISFMDFNLNFILKTNLFSTLLCTRHHRGEGNGTPTPVLLPRKSHGRRSLVGYTMGSLESDTTEWLHFHFSHSCIGQGNGIPLQCSCLEDPRGREAWWAAVYGVAQSQTRLKWCQQQQTPQRKMKFWEKTGSYSYKTENSKMFKFNSN